MPLISSADFAALPVEPERRWLSLFDLVDARLDQRSDYQQGNSDQDLREYCTVLISAAEELQLGSFQAYSIDEIRRDYPLVRSRIVELATRLNVRVSTANAALSVALKRPTKEKLLAQIERLAEQLQRADLSERQRQGAQAKLDELRVLILSPRVDFARVMAILGFLGAAVVGVTSILADGPDAISTIVALIGEDKVEEEEEHRLLQLEKAPLQLQDLRADSDLDQEVPF